MSDWALTAEQTDAPVGELLICQGSLLNLACDAMLIPTDAECRVEAPWRATLESEYGLEFDPWHRLVNAPRREVMRRERVWKPAVSESSTTPTPDIWFGDVARATPEDVVETAANFVQRAAAGLESALEQRHVPLLALPFVGTRKGGHGESQGTVAKHLIRRLEEAAACAGVDVALVIFENSPAFSAAQQQRGNNPHAAALGPALCKKADDLASAAARGQVVVFIGSGMSRAAGAASWNRARGCTRGSGRTRKARRGAVGAATAPG